MMLTSPQTAQCPACQVATPLDVLLGIDKGTPSDARGYVEPTDNLDAVHLVDHDGTIEDLTVEQARRLALGLLEAARFVDGYQRTRAQLRAEWNPEPTAEEAPA